MELQAVPVISAAWLGILTSISPCPLTSNIAAVSYIMRGGRPARVLLAGLVYTLGRVMSYSLLGILISASLLNIPLMSHVMQTYLPKIIGPVLIITGICLLDLISFNLPGGSLAARAAERFKESGFLGAFPLGILFALAFCPISAALFFGSLIPLAIKHESPLLLPSLYGIGTGLPVMAFAFLIALGIKNVGRVYAGITRTEIWVRRITAGILIIIGIYYTARHIFYIELF
jgi:cytochrome c biogenesis protein CcdA